MTRTRTLPLDVYIKKVHTDLLHVQTKLCLEAKTKRQKVTFL